MTFIWRTGARRLIGASLLTGALAFLPACAHAGGRLYLRIGPPAPIVEVRGTAPGAGYFWIEGHHQWDGRGYVWVPGRWELAPRPRAVWVPGHWAQDRQGWYYVEGRWR